MSVLVMRSLFVVCEWPLLSTWEGWLALLGNVTGVIVFVGGWLWLARQELSRPPSLKPKKETSDRKE